MSRNITQQNTINNILVKWRVEPHFEGDKRSKNEWIISFPKCPIHEARFAFCDNSPQRPLIPTSRYRCVAVSVCQRWRLRKSAYGIKIWLSWSEWSKPLSIVCATLNLTKTRFTLNLTKTIFSMTRRNNIDNFPFCSCCLCARARCFVSATARA